MQWRKSKVTKLILCKRYKKEFILDEMMKREQSEPDNFVTTQLSTRCRRLIKLSPPPLQKKRKWKNVS